MNRKTFLAITISLFLMPGMGHVYLGQKVKGYLISVTLCLILLALLVLFDWELIQQAKNLTNPKMLFSSFFPLAKKAWMAHVVTFCTGLGLMTVLWIGSAVDVYRLGRKRKEESRN